MVGLADGVGVAVGRLPCVGVAEGVGVGVGAAVGPLPRVGVAEAAGVARVEPRVLDRAAGVGSNVAAGTLL